MERLNHKQLRALRSHHPHNNRNKFFDAVSTVTLTPNMNEEKRAFLQEMTKLKINVNVRLVNA